MRAFTLIELIFVIVIMGIMTKVGFSAFKPHYLVDDVNFITAKIKEAQFLGTGFEHLKFGEGEISGYDNVGCIHIEKSALEENATAKNQVNYKLHVTIDPADTTLCFDAQGRPHKDAFDTEPLSEQTTFTFSYGGKDKTITIEPITGYVIITN